MRSNFGQKGPRMNDMTGDRRVQGKTPVHKKYILTRLWGYLSRHTWLLIFAAILAVSSNLLGLLGPNLSGKAIALYVRGAADAILEGREQAMQGVVDAVSEEGDDEFVEVREEG